MKKLKISIPDFVAGKLDKKKLQTMIDYAENEIAEWMRFVSACEDKKSKIKK